MESKKWCKGLFRVLIGDEKGTSLWFDQWMPGGKSLFDTFLARVLASTGINWKAKVDIIIRNGVWTFPQGHHALQQA